jgi:hypothetical protein
MTDQLVLIKLMQLDEALINACRLGFGTSQTKHFLKIYIFWTMPLFLLAKHKQCIPMY